MRKNEEIVTPEHILAFAGLILLIIFAVDLATTSSSHHMMQSSNNYLYLIVPLALVLIAYPIIKESGDRGDKGSETLSGNKEKINEELTHMDPGMESVKSKDVESVESEGVEELERESVDGVENVRKVPHLPEIINKLLREDDLRVVKIILENEGVTQDSLHFRTGFSHSKLSMIIKNLEEKDLIVREKFGRTYKIYLSGHNLIFQ